MDPDVERILKESMRRQSKSFKQALNDAIRQGLAKAPSGGKRREFVIKARPMGFRSGIDPAKLSDLATELEIDDYKATTDKLSARTQ